MDIPSTTVITTKTLIDGTGGPPLELPTVVVEDDKITAVDRQGEVQPPQRPDVRELEFPEGHLLPGLIDAHTHLMFGTVEEHGYRNGPYETVIERDTDEILREGSPTRTVEEFSAESGAASVRSSTSQV